MVRLSGRHRPPRCQREGSGALNEATRRGFPVTAWSAVNSLGTRTQEVISALRSGVPSLSGPPENTPHCNDIEFLTNFFWPQLTAQEQHRIYIALGFDMDGFEDNILSSTHCANKICTLLSKCNKCPRNVLGYSSGKRAELCSCQHAERNALNKLPIPAKGLVMFCWCGVPCIQCSGSIINAGIQKVHCIKEKDYHTSSRWLFKHGSTTLIEHDAIDLEL